jgi:hypothetical protein
MTAWRLALGESSRGIAAIPICLFLVLAEVSSAQDHPADSIAKTTDWSRRDSIRAELARPGNTECQVRGDFRERFSPLTACEMSRVPVPTGMGLYRVGEWRWIVHTSPKSDRLDAIFILPVTNAAPPHTGAFVLMCEHGILRARLDPERPLEHVYADVVTVQFGTEPPEEQRWFAGPPKGQQWVAGADSTTLYVSRDQKTVRAFVRKLANYQRFLFRVRPHEGAQRTLAFDQGDEGLVSAQMMLAGCN